jgi:hypothetical protein
MYEEASEKWIQEMFLLSGSIHQRLEVLHNSGRSQQTDRNRTTMTKGVQFRQVLLYTEKNQINYKSKRSVFSMYCASSHGRSVSVSLLTSPTVMEHLKTLMDWSNILRNTTQVIIRHRVKILFSVISSPIMLERQKWKSSKMKGILISSPQSYWTWYDRK